jgi:hypothetical protein
VRGENSPGLLIITPLDEKVADLDSIIMGQCNYVRCQKLLHMLFSLILNLIKDILLKGVRFTQNDKTLSFEILQ